MKKLLILIPLLAVAIVFWLAYTKAKVPPTVDPIPVPESVAITPIQEWPCDGCKG